MKAIINRIIDLLEIYLRGSLGGRLFGAGFLFVTAVIGVNYNLALNIVHEDSLLSGTISSANLAWWIEVVALVLGITLMLAGIYFWWQTYKDQLRKKIIALEIRGLNNAIDTPLTTGIPRHIAGRRELHLIDVRELVNGTPAQQAKAVEDINSIPRLEQIQEKMDATTRWRRYRVV
jgi:hypothetical protein